MTLSAQRPESDGNFPILSLDNTFHQACLQWLSLLKKLLNACHKYEMPIIISSSSVLSLLIFTLSW